MATPNDTATSRKISHKDLINELNLRLSEAADRAELIGYGADYANKEIGEKDILPVCYGLKRELEAINAFANRWYEETGEHDGKVNDWSLEELVAIFAPLSDARNMIEGCRNAIVGFKSEGHYNEMIAKLDRAMQPIETTIAGMELAKGGFS